MLPSRRAGHLTEGRSPVRVAWSSPVGLRVRRTWRLSVGFLEVRRTGRFLRAIAIAGARKARSLPSSRLEPRGSVFSGTECALGRHLVERALEQGELLVGELRYE